MTRSLLTFSLLLLLITASARADEIAILRTFPGDSGPGPKDNPDNTGGVGPSHVVDSTDAHVVIHDKATGHVLKQMTQTEFWQNAKPGFTIQTLNDPRLTYDPLAERWYMVAQARHRRETCAEWLSRRPFPVP